MSKFVSKLLHGASAFDKDNETSATYHFILRPNSENSDITNVYSIDQPPESAAIYTIMSGQSSQHFYRGDPHPQNSIAQCTSAKMGLVQNAHLRGQQISIRTSAVRTKYIVQSPTYGRLEWKPNPITGTGLYLYNTSGERLAAFKSNGLMNYQQKQLLVFVPCGGDYIEMILVTACAAKILDRTVTEIIMEIVGAA
jgi:hypothetical protein